ncbi:MAG: transcription-repair coupling factor [Kiritimatiellae bacterium]|nr:transcription-repair coupling factor [Kiritimatiellia bacterium]
MIKAVPDGYTQSRFTVNVIRGGYGVKSIGDTVNIGSPGTEETWSRLTEELSARKPDLQLFSGDPPPPRMVTIDFPVTAVPGLSELGADVARHPELLAQARRSLLDAFIKQGQEGSSIFLCADTAGTCELLLREVDGAAGIAVRRLSLSGGFALPGCIVAAQPDLYAVRKKNLRRTTSFMAPTAPVGQRIEQTSDLEPGDYVVHVDYGIGRFLGSTEIEVDGVRSEVFTIEYAGGARLHVSVNNAHLLSRYVGVAGHPVKLHSLGGKRWTREKADAERAVQDLAGSLLETQARREVVEGIAFDPEPMCMREFEADFPYQETVDQERVIEEIKHDMALTRPMDRLVCGDAGYGKTEVAMRAAFIAVMNGKQVAVLVPTTVLSEQHYETFCDRMAPYPVRIAVANRLHSAAKREAAFRDTESGQVDILIGTHALLSNRLKFKDLGLLIIDEEQRFGVAHKEKLKCLRQVVDVLTLSATPIPRTLYMSMTGARDMSLLQTPPRERVPVETRVVRDTDPVLRQAILQEVQRGGQIFFLHNRVMTIEIMRARLERLVPDVRIAVAHGQMPPEELSRKMAAFESGEIDLLLCTTIVESGLDIPRANTMIVHRADRFGIAELYQLRGRVGRSSVMGFCWLVLPEQGVVDAEARERIAALRKHSGLGSGFNLARRDLEIRGSGNLLGSAQSGHIAAVGFGLYCQLLKRTIARLKGEKPPLLVDVELRFDFLDFSPGMIDPLRSACLPYGYMEDEGHRMLFHRRLAEITSVKEMNAFARELTDRYGRPPEAVRRLIKLTTLRVLAAERRIALIETRDNKIYLYNRRDRVPIRINGQIPALTGKNPDQYLTRIEKVLKAYQPA